MKNKPDKKKPINYRKGGDEVREAYFKWRTIRKDETHNVVGFVAGFNASRDLT